MQQRSEAFYKKRGHFFGFQIFTGRAIEGDSIFIRKKFFDGLMVLKVDFYRLIFDWKNGIKPEVESTTLLYDKGADLYALKKGKICAYNMR